MKPAAILFVIFCATGMTAQSQTVTKVRPLNGFAGIIGRVADKTSGLAVPSRIEIYNSAKELQQTYYKFIPGIFTEEDGSFRMPLPPGKYTLKISHANDYLSQQREFEITAAAGVEVYVLLEPWLPLRDKGWINGEAHAHLYTEKHPDLDMLKTIRKICRAQGIDFICAAQGWAGATDSTWRKEYASITDKHFTMYYGSEMPKYRTGHTFWIGLESTKGIFPSLMDTLYENRYYQSSTATHWDFSSLDLPNFTDVELVPRLARAQNAAAIVPHPTRWWMQERGTITKYTNNAAVNTAFSLLSGNLWDGMVIMGDRKDHYSYQNFWFNILNLGYRMPAFSELDGGITPDFKYPYGLMRTYFRIDTANHNTVQAVVDAVRKGRTFVTSGPVILTSIDGKYSIGDVIPSDETLHTMHLEAYASGDRDDQLSYVMIFRNGALWRQWDIRPDHLRTFKKDLTFIEKERAWYVVKAYGKKTWDTPERLDIMKSLDNHIMEPTEHDLCMTSPYYFLPKGQTEPKPLVSEISLTLVTPDKKKVDHATLEVYLLGKKINEVPFKNGKADFSMPVNATISVVQDGKQRIHRSLYLDYEPHRRLLQKLSNGDWRNDPEFKDLVFPGYIPWKAFQVEETRKLLQKVNWEIILEPNERDAQWDRYEQLLQTRN